MSKKTFSAAALFAACLLASGAFAEAPPVTLTIHANQPVAAVSPTLYGLMTEEINYSYDGGLYAEMVRNRTFQRDFSGVIQWFLLEQGNSEAKMEGVDKDGPSAALTSSLKIEVKKADDANPAGVLNTGWWGMPVRPDSTYTGSFYAKAVGDLGPVTVALVANQTGKVLASTQVSGVGSDWKQYSFTLKSGAKVDVSAANHLAITVQHPGTLFLQLVSLFPPTYHNRPYGNRVDLMEKLEAMHPAFLRFPGGNYLEGNHISERFDWKKTIGPQVDRPTHQSPWGYSSSDGMGLLEFLGWCEDLHMNPVLAVYAGYSLSQEHVNPGKDLEPYVQDALDEVEYVTGSTSTKWGAVRAQNGHPEPFKLTYVEIGNEDGFDNSHSYDDRYAQFYKAIKAKYPELQLIATTPVKSIRPDVVDDHYYMRAVDTSWSTGLYDGRDRKGPKIFVGEWATREGSPTPNMGAALGDAAFMTSLERNSDLIVMASYAPLLVNINPSGMQWDTDLIGYDALNSYGSPAYYAQVMFASHLGDQVLASKAEGAGPKFFYSITGNAVKKKLYLKLVNASSTARPVHLELAGVKLATTARVETLAAKDTQATNTMEHPTQVAPVKSELKVSGNTIQHTLAPYTVQVVEFDMQ